MSAVSVPFTLFISVLELLVAFLQAYVFTMLSALFIGTAVAEHEHH
jgi:F-type H+-transporting ATPase subunit a